MKQISLITTVLNEGDSIRPLLDSITRQTMPPDEVVICDGGSIDKTVAIIHEYEEKLPIRLIVANGANISQGRNRAIEEAEGYIICATDAGVILSPRWVEKITKAIREDEKDVVSGWFESAPESRFETVMGATVLPNRNEIDPLDFLPSSRSVAFTKDAWQSVKGYPEWLDYGEDLVYDFALRERYGKFPFAPLAIAYFRPRKNLRAFAKQYYLYARGDGKANLWKNRYILRYVIYCLLLPVLLCGILQGKKRSMIVLAVAGYLYCWTPILRFWRASTQWSMKNRIVGLAQIPIIRAVGDIAKMVGYPIGVLWRLRHRK